MIRQGASSVGFMIYWRFLHCIDMNIFRGRRPRYCRTFLTTLFLINTLIQVDIAHARVYDEDQGSWSGREGADYDGSDFQNDDDDQGRYKRGRGQFGFSALPGFNFKDWDNEPVVTALDDVLSSLSNLLRVFVHMTLVYYRRLRLIFTFPYSFLHPIASLFTVYRTSDVSTAVVRYGYKPVHQGQPVVSRMYSLSRLVGQITWFTVASLSISAVVRRAANNANVRNFMSRRGHGFVSLLALVILADLTLVVIQLGTVAAQLANALVILVMYLVAWISVPVFLCGIFYVMAKAFMWLFRDRKGDRR